MKNRVKMKDVKYFILLAPFFEPMFFRTVKVISAVYSISFYLELIMVLVYFLNRRRKPNSISVSMLLFGLVILGSTLINKSDLNTAWTYIKFSTLLALVIDFLSTDFNRVLKSLLIHSELCIYINLFTVVFFRNGIYHRTANYYGTTNEWFLGPSNYFIFWIISGLFFSYLNAELTERKMRTIIISVASVVTEIIEGSTTGIVGVAVFLLLMYLPLIKKMLTPRVTAMLFIILLVMIVVFNNVEFLSPIVVGLLGKRLTFTERDLIWANALTAIRNKPIIGYGALNGPSTVALIGFIWGENIETVVHCHNQFLQVTLISGVIGLIAYAFVYYANLRSCIDLWESKIAQISCYAILTLSVIGITEQTFYPETFMILVVPFYLPLLNDTPLKEFMKRRCSIKKRETRRLLKKIQE